jgi:hypothetical protein
MTDLVTIEGTLTARGIPYTTEVGDDFSTSIYIAQPNVANTSTVLHTTMRFNPDGSLDSIGSEETGTSVRI